MFLAVSVIAIVWLLWCLICLGNVNGCFFFSSNIAVYNFGLTIYNHTKFYPDGNLAALKIIVEKISMNRYDSPSFSLLLPSCCLLSPLLSLSALPCTCTMQQYRHYTRRPPPQSEIELNIQVKVKGLIDTYNPASLFTTLASVASTREDRYLFFLSYSKEDVSLFCPCPCPVLRLPANVLSCRFIQQKIDQSTPPQFLIFFITVTLPVDPTDRPTSQIVATLVDK